MSWMAKLHETYEHCLHQDDIQPWPISHFVKNAHIEVVLDEEGRFQAGRSKILTGDESPTLIPATESSAGRSGAKIAPHPLSDELGYCASDLPKIKSKKCRAYIEQLEAWSQYDTDNTKLKAIFAYLKEGRLWGDLSREIDFPIKFKNKRGKTTKINPEKTFIRWRVEKKGGADSATWEDVSLIESWQKYDRRHNSMHGFCFIEGKQSRISVNHPRFIRHPGDGSKLISSNDSSGFTFRGRFMSSNQATEIGFDVTQKAHNTLRWLIARQGYRNEDQIYVSWAVSGESIPKPTDGSWDLLGDDLVLEDDMPMSDPDFTVDHGRNLGAAFAIQLKNYMAGYQAKLNPTEDVVVMGIDSATPGRMSVIYYRELMASEFLDRLTRWHTEFVWYQRHKRELPVAACKKPKTETFWPVCSPAPRNIAEAAYGVTLTDELKKSVVERIMPCIIDAATFPRDLLDSAIRRVINRVSYKSDDFWRWEQDLGITCALYRGYFLRHPKPNLRKEYSMSLEENNHSRDYLYGRLLAIAERIEEVALSVGGENRTTTAARLMQRFADRPYSTWRNIELALLPYMQRLQASRTGFLVNQKKELDNVLAAFATNDFTSEKPLSGEFLLAYHCQRLISHKNSTQSDTNKEGSK